GRLLDMRHVFERIGAIADAGGTSEVVNRHRIDARFGETPGEVLVDLMQAAHIWQHNHPGSRRLLRACKAGGELVPIGSGEGELAVVGGGSTDRRQRRTSFV